MYNAFIVRKKTIEVEEMKKKSEANKRYVSRYYNVTRPALIDSHNKRINSFIRRMEEEPIQIHLDPYSKNSDESFNLSTTRARAFSNMTHRRESPASDQYQPLTPHQQTFKFKDNQDWKSLLTPLERIQRQRNYQLFKSKYGDPTIAYRSIGSQSEYKPGHQYRQRDKDLEINPPMRYTNKPTKQILAKLKNKYKQKKDNQTTKIDENKPITVSDRQQDALVRRNTSSSLSSLVEDSLLNDNLDRMSKHEHSDKQPDDPNQNSNKNIKKKKQLKFHFKQIMDLEQNISDIKTRKALRQILYKCGVYRRKNRRVATDSQIDKLSEFTDGRDIIRDH